MSRFVKQLIYGLSYLLILAIVVWLIYFLFIKQPASCFDNRLNQNELGIDCGGPCLSCDLKQVQDLRTAAVQLFDNGNETLTVLAEITNPNAALGIDNLPYTINLFDNGGNKVLFVNRVAFVYPGEKLIILEPGMGVNPSLIKRAEVVLDYDISSWKTKEEFSLPAVRLANLEKKILADRILITGQVVNENSFPLLGVDVLARVFNKLKITAAVSKTVVGKIEPFSQQSFEVVIPVSKEAIADIDLTETSVIVRAKK